MEPGGGMGGVDLVTRSDRDGAGGYWQWHGRSEGWRVDDLGHVKQDRRRTSQVGLKWQGWSTGECLIRGAVRGTYHLLRHCLLTGNYFTPGCSTCQWLNGSRERSQSHVTRIYAGWERVIDQSWKHFQFKMIILDRPETTLTVATAISPEYHPVHTRTCGPCF